MMNGVLKLLVFSCVLCMAPVESAPLEGGIFIAIPKSRCKLDTRVDARGGNGLSSQSKMLTLISWVI